MRGDSTIALNSFVKASNTALIVVDMQEAFVGKDASVQVPNRNAIIDANFRLIKLIRGLKIPIVWTQVYLDKWNYSVYSELWPEHFNGDRIRVLSKDNMDSKIVDKLLKEISREDLIIPKHRYSAFYNPELKKWLITNHIENILFSGVTTNVCVESTIRDAFQLGFRPFLISDATGTFSEELQKAAETIIGFVFGYIISIDDIEKQFGSNLYNIAST